MKTDYKTLAGEAATAAMLALILILTRILLFSSCGPINKFEIMLSGALALMSGDLIKQPQGATTWAKTEAAPTTTTSNSHS